MIRPSTPRPSACIEPLEARIAPAVIRIGAIGTGLENSNDTEYREFIVPNDPDRGPRAAPYNVLAFTDTSASTDLISQAVGTSPDQNTFFLRLQGGDTVEKLTDNNYRPYIVVKSGQVIAFFTDLNFNNDFDDGELTGLALGANTVLEINGRVDGDIVTNLDERGTRDRADDTIDMDGLVSSKQGIKSLKVLGGSLSGNILSGGAIQSLEVAKNVDNVFAGAATSGISFDFFKSQGGNGVITYNPAPGELGASISNAVVGSITGKMAAGAGGAGAKGGSLLNIQVTGDIDGFELLAGEGGSGDAASKRLNGGNGGDVTNVYVNSITDNSPNSGNGVVIRAGDGGTAELTGRGGAGGLLKNVNVGYSLTNSKLTPSAGLLTDNVTIAAGGGGAGKTGGLGGTASLVKVRILTPDVQGNEIDVRAGDGGDSTSPNGAAGAGGTVRDLDLRNQISTPNGDILVQAGSGGGGSATSRGANGGSVINTSLLGFDLQLLAGDGSDGTIGGNGGAVTNVLIVRDDLIIPRNVLVNAGHGGTGFTGAGGAGGDVRGVTSENGDFQSVLINVGIGADGGASFKGRGGKGGGVFNISLTDNDSNFGVSTTLEGEVAIRTGRGGDGTTGGGNGGAMDRVSITGDNLNMAAEAGAGGDALTKGAGGVGGTLSTVQLESRGLVNNLPVTGQLKAGDGGDGKGAGGAGGVGGDIRASSSIKLAGDVDVLPANYVGNAKLLAGNGGNGENTVGKVTGGVAGRGGSIIASGLFAEQGSGEMRAGDAGIGGARAAAGGSIIGNTSSSGDQIGLRAATSLTATAGDGSHGGQGGDIIGLAYGSTAVLLSPTPSGSILFQAGNGSGLGSTAGRGGNIDTVNGSVSSGVGMKTEFYAGDGGGGANVTRSGAGGTIKNITISRGGAEGGLLLFEAGDAGDAPLASSGAAGGSVLNIGVTDISSATVFRSVAAGDGGDAKSRGGTGGSINGVDVRQHDIGVRTGEKFGYATQGGLFAGVGGAATKAGLNGSVSNVTADSISSIVAGRNGVPHLTEKVSDVYVAGSNKTLLVVSNQALVPNGDFQLRFGPETTSLLASSSSAAKVQQALNLLDGIAALGGVTVSSTSSGGYSIQFNVPGNQSEISGLEILKSEVDETVTGATGDLNSTTTTEGRLPLTVTEVRSGQDSLVVVEISSGSALFSTSEQISGSATANEVQVLSLQALSQFPTAQFQLRFGSSTTPLLPANATAAQIETALNNLASVRATGPTNNGTVTVALAPNETDRFIITFSFTGAQETIIGTRLLPEIQRLNLGQVPSFPNATFTLSFGGQTTAPLPYNATAAQIDSALDILNPIVAAGGVTVTDLGNNQFDIRFGLVGERAEIVGVAKLPELQRIGLDVIPTSAGATFFVAFGTERTALLPVNATASQIETALNGLPSILAAGGVSVSLAGNGAVDVTFLSTGDKSSLSSSAVQKERQSLDLNSLSGNSNSEYALSALNEIDVSETTKGTLLTFPVTETQPGQFSLLTLTVTPGSTNTQEVQQVNVATIAATGGSGFRLVFAGQTTGFITVQGTTALTATAIQNALNVLPAIASLGGVTVVAQTTAGIYNITFSPTGDFPQITGTGFVPEIQQMNVGTLVGVPGGEYTISFGGDTTAVLPNTATAAQIQTALNALNSVIAESGVVVTAGAAGVFNIRFNQTGTPADQPSFVVTGGGTASHEHQMLDLGSLTAYTSGQFQLTFGGQTTDPLPVTATAAQIKAALDVLPAVQATRSGNTGVVAVNNLGGGKFDIVFNYAGDQGPITAEGAVLVDRYPIHVNETHSGTQLPVLVSETRSGNTAVAEVAELVAGSASVREVQRVDLAALNGVTVGDFTLRFGAVSTLPIPATATAAQVQAALNLLQSVQAAGGVTVVAGPGKTFDVTFGGFGDRLTLGAETRVAEIQSVDLNAISALAGGEFSLVFGNQATAPLSVNATAAQVQAALNALPSIQAVDGVTVTATGAGKFAVTFQTLGNIAPLSGFGGGTAGHETQQVNLSNLIGVAGGTFKLTFNGESTTPLSATATAAEIATALNALDSVKDLRGDRTGAVVVTANATPGLFDISFNTFGDQAVIKGKSLTTTDRVFSSVELRAGSASTSVPVSETTPGAVAVKEVQTINLATIRSTTGEFQLSFDNNTNDGTPGSKTPLLAANAAAGDIENALNSLASITAAGGVTVAAGLGDTVVVTFNTNGNRDSIVGTGGLHEQQTVALGSLATEAGGLFRLVFNGEATRALPVTATAADLDAAMDALATIKALRSGNSGSVTVSEISPGNFQVDFDDLGNQSALSGIGAVSIKPALDIHEVISGTDVALVVRESLHGQLATVPTSEVTPGTDDSQEVQRIDLSNVFTVTGGVFRLNFGFGATAYLSRFVTPAELQTALNALTTITNVGGVTVTAGPTANTFDVTFNSDGNQALLLSGSGGVREVQTIDTNLLQLAGNSGFNLTFGADTTAVPLPENATPAQVANALNALPSISSAGGVTVAQGTGGFDVFFNIPGDQSSISSTASLFETQIIDLQTLPATDNGRIDLTFNGQTTSLLSSGASAVQIQNALNSLSSIQALGPGNTGSVSVANVAPGVFRVDFNVAGNQPLISGTSNPFGTTDRLSSSATAGEIDAALDSVSFGNVTVTNGSVAGVFVVDFQIPGNQAPITGESFIHEEQRVDIYSVGEFTLTLGDDTTAPLPATATAEQIRSALNALPSVVAVGGVTEVILGENSSFSVVFASDSDVGLLSGAQRIDPLIVNTPTQGGAGIREVQTVSFTPKGAFVEEGTNAFVGFLKANFVGAIYDFNEIDSNVFHWTELNNLPGFNEGDLPIDGIVMAKIFDQKTVNFTPEAKLTAAGFYDYNNKISL
jgi:hypothetical protein